MAIFQYKCASCPHSIECVGDVDTIERTAYENKGVWCDHCGYKLFKVTDPIKAEPRILYDGL